MTLEFHPYPILQTTQPQAQEQEQQQFNSLNRTLENMAQTAQTQRQRNFENPILQAQNDRAQRTSDLEHKNAVDLQNAFSDMNPNHTLGTTVNAPQGGASTDGTPPGGTPWGGNVGPSQSDSSPSMGAAPGTYPGTPQPSMQPRPSVVDQWKEKFGQGNAGPKSMFGARNPAEFDLKSKMFNMGQEADKNAADINLKNAQAKSLSQRDPMAEFKLKTGEKEDQFYQKEWDKIVKDSDPITASSRSGLGMASKADYNANRALTTLSKPMVTNQEAGNVMADIAQIYQGGSPTEYGMSHQGYNTLYQKIQGAIQNITGNPQDALPDAIKQRLIGVLNEMKTTNKAVIKQQLDHIERAQPQIINRYNDQWKGIRQNLEGGISGGPDNQGGSNQITPDVVAYAQKHGITPQQALQIKIQRTGGQ